MSRPTTPHGISPRGSYVNLLEGREEGAFSPSKIEKERLRAEAEVNAALLKDKEGDKKKEEAPVSAGSPGESMPSPNCPNETTGVELILSPPHPQLLRGVHHDDGRQQVRRLGQSVHNDLPP